MKANRHFVPFKFEYLLYLTVFNLLSHKDKKCDISPMFTFNIKFKHMQHYQQVFSLHVNGKQMGEIWPKFVEDGWIQETKSKQ